MESILLWVGIVFCITQSAMFSGLNLAFFSLNRLNLEIEYESKPSVGTKRILKMRDDSNFLLTTILWGNVGINVLLTLLSDSVMAGVLSFMFSTIIITLFGEIIPQAYFSRNSIKMASVLSPVLRIYQIILYPVAKPSAIILDKWLGKESIQYYAETEFKRLIQKHIDSSENDIGRLEGVGAINFLSIDDLKVIEEGELIHPKSIIQLSLNELGEIMFPKYNSSIDDEFIIKINSSEEKWVIIVDNTNTPKLILNADGFIRSTLFSTKPEPILHFCHKPLIITHSDTQLVTLIKSMCLNSNTDTPIDNDIVVVWTNNSKRIVTGADILGRLLKDT